MISSYEVGSIFRIVDNATPALLKIAEQFEKVSLKIKAVDEQLLALGKGTATGLGTTLTNLEKKLGGVAEKVGLTKDAVVGNFEKMDGAISTSVLEVEKLSKALGAARLEAAGLGRVRVGVTGGGGGAGAGGGGDRRREPSRGRGGHGGTHLQTPQHVGIDMGLGIGGLIGAESIGHLLFEQVKGAAELSHVQEQMLQGGFKAQEVAGALAKSWQVASKYGIDVAKVMGDIKELRTPFGSTEHAIGFIEPLEKMRVVLDAVKEGEGGNSKDAIYKMARAGELKGLVDANDYLKYFDAMTKVISATGGKVGPNDFMQATKYARLSALGLDETYYTKYLPTMIQALGASGAGTANAALFGTLIQGKASGRSVGAMDEIGLFADRSKLRFDKKGDTIGFSSGAIVDSDLLTRNPLEWVRKDLLPRMEKKFGDLADSKNKEKAIDNLGDFFGNRMSAQAVGEMLFRMKSFDRDAGYLDKAKGLDGAETLQQHDPIAAAEKMRGAFENMLKAFGGPLVEPATKAMIMITDGMTSLTKWANENPAAVKAIGAATAGIVAGLALLTGAAIVSAAAVLAPGGAIALAVATIGGAIAGLAAMNWGAVSTGLKSLWEAIERFFTWLKPGGPGGGGDTDAIGALPQAYRGPGVGGGSLLQDASYVTGDGGGDMGAKLIQASLGGGGGDGKASAVIAGGVAGGITNSSGGIINILGGGSGGLGGFGGGGGGYGGGGGGGGYGSGGGSGSNQAFSNAGIESVRKYIRAKATALGIDPNIAERVARSEGLNSTLGAGGDHGTSDGPYQLHVGGGIGDAYERLYHRSIHDKSPQAVKDQIDFALGYARTNGWSAWHGAAHVGIGNHQGIGVTPPSPVAKTNMPPPPPPKATVHHITVPLHVDGKVMAKVVTKHQTKMASMPHAIGGQDDYGSWASPGTTMMPS